MPVLLHVENLVIDLITILDFSILSILDISKKLNYPPCSKIPNIQENVGIPTMLL